MARLISAKVRYFIAMAVFLGMLISSGWTPAYADSAQTSRLLQQAKMSAIQLRNDSALMESFTRSRLSWESHTSQINLIKGHINKSGKILADLHDARDGAAPWQQEVIDRITPLLQEMASNTESIIAHLNDRQQTWHPEYQGYLKSNAEVSTDLSQLIGDYINFGNAKSRMEKMSQSLGFSGS